MGKTFVFLAAVLPAVCGKANAADPRASPPVADGRNVLFDERGLTLRSLDDSVNFRLGGRLQMDFGAGGSPALADPVPDAVLIRRLWIEPRVTIDKDLVLGLQYDPRSYATRPIHNLLASYKGFGPFMLTVGNFKEPVSLEGLTSNKDITFMERSLAFAFVPGRETGVAIGTHGEKWTLAIAALGGNVNTGAFQQGIAAGMRGTYAPILTSTEVLHFGLSGNYRWLDWRRPDVSFATRPESFLFTTSLVNTGTIGAQAVGRLGAEFAWTKGPFRTQAEYIVSQVERQTAGAVTFHGGYAQAGWTLNGKSAPYAIDSDVATEAGAFKQVQLEPQQRLSQGGVGVFEVAARYSAIDLNSGDIAGGFQQDVTLGLNWYPEPFIRVTTNYVHAWANPTAQSLTGLPTQADIGQFRLQIAF